MVMIKLEDNGEDKMGELNRTIRWVEGAMRSIAWGS